MSSARFVHRRVVLPLGVACAGAAVAAQGGRISAHLDILTHFAPIYLAGGVVVLIAALFARTRLPAALLGGVAVASSLMLILPELWRPASPPALADAAGRIKIIQFNAATDSQGLEARLDWLARQDPDVLIVEDSRAVFQTALVERMGRHMSCGMTCEVAIFTRDVPLRIESPRRGRVGLGPAIAVVHLAGPRGPFTVVGVHYEWPTAVDNHRENSIRLLEIMGRMDKQRAILAGDFNSTPWSFARRREDAALGLERRTRALFSWPANGPFGLAFLPIDHLYAGANWRTVAVTRGPRVGSDHYPIVAVLAQP